MQGESILYMCWRASLLLLSISPSASASLRAQFSRQVARLAERWGSASGAERQDERGAHNLDREFAYLALIFFLIGIRIESLKKFIIFMKLEVRSISFRSGTAPCHPAHPAHLAQIHPDIHPRLDPLKAGVHDADELQRREYPPR
jgi:hypothetical protein